MCLNWPRDPLIPDAGRSLAQNSLTGRAIRPFFLPTQEVVVGGLYKGECLLSDINDLDHCNSAVRFADLSFTGVKANLRVSQERIPDTGRA